MANFSQYGVDLSATAFQDAATKYRRELLQLPIIGLERYTKYMTLRPGVRYREAIGTIGGEVTVRPYQHDLTPQNITIGSRTLETEHGSIVVDFEPNSLASTVLANHATSADAMKSEPICRDILAYIARSASKSLLEKMFNGINNIISNEVWGENKVTDAFGSYSGIKSLDYIGQLVQTLSIELKDQESYMFVGYTEYLNILRIMQNENYFSIAGVFGDKENKDLKLPFTNGNITVVPVADNFMKLPGDYNTNTFITTKENLLVGFDQMSDMEAITVKDYKPYMLTFIMDMFFGVQFASLDKSVFMYIHNDK